MLTKKKEAQELLAEYNKLFAPILNKSCVITFDKHRSDGFIVSDVSLRKLEGLKVKPEKVEFDGKMRSPLLFEIQNNQAPLIFILEDTKVAALSNGVRLTIDLDKPINDKHAIEVDIRLE